MAQRRVFAAGAVATALLVGGLGIADAQPGDPGSPSKVSGTLVAGGQVESDADFSPDGRWVVYRADQDTDGLVELYAVPAGGGTPTKLNNALPADEDVVAFRFSPDSSRVIYLSGKADSFDLLSVPLDGGSAATPLSPPMPPGRGVAFQELSPGISLFGAVVSPDSQWVVYGADQDTNDVFEVYSVPLAGGAANKLNDPPPVGGTLFAIAPIGLLGLDFFPGMRITDDSTRVIYFGDGTVNDRDELYAAAVDGTGSPLTLNDPLGANRDVGVGSGVFGFGVTYILDGTTVLYVADQDINDVGEIYRTDVEGGSVAKIHTPLLAGRSVEQVQLHRPSGRVLYLADADIDEQVELYSVSQFGATPTKLNPALPPTSDVSFFFLSPIRNALAYTADLNADDNIEVLGVGVGGGASVALTPGIDVGNLTQFIAFAPDGVTVIVPFGAPMTTSDLYAANVFTGGPRRVATNLGDLDLAGPNGFISATDGLNRVVYLSGDAAGPTTLRSVVVETSDLSSPAQLNGPLVVGGNVEDYHLSPDGARVLFRADQDTDGVFELYVVDVGHSCKGQLATITGTPGDDDLTGTSGDDVIVALVGDDTVNGGGGDDLICTGGGEDTVNGGPGADEILTGAGQDTVNGGPGNDRIVTGKANDIANGGPGNDRIVGNGGRDALAGNGGNDDIAGGGANDELTGAKGNDDLSGGKGADLLDGGPGNDDLTGGPKADTCNGGPGIDTATTCETVTSIRRAS